MLHQWAFFVAWMLSFCGISVGYYGCSVYGPPDDLPREQLYDLKEEVFYLEKRLESLNKEKAEIIKSVDKRNLELNKLQSEKDSLIILLNSDEK
jgi:hypothetical protein